MKLNFRLAIAKKDFAYTMENVLNLPFLKDLFASVPKIIKAFSVKKASAMVILAAKMVIKPNEEKNSIIVYK